MDQRQWEIWLCHTCGNIFMTAAGGSCGLHFSLRKIITKKGWRLQENGQIRRFVVHSKSVSSSRWQALSLTSTSVPAFRSHSNKVRAYFWQYHPAGQFLSNRQMNPRPPHCDGSSAQLWPRFPPTCKYLRGIWLSHSWWSGAAGALRCLGWVSGRLKWGCALSERAAGGLQVLSVKPKGERWKGLLGSEHPCRAQGAGTKAFSSEMHTPPREEPALHLGPRCANFKWASEPYCSSSPRASHPPCTESSFQLLGDIRLEQGWFLNHYKRNPEPAMLIRQIPKWSFTVSDLLQSAFNPQTGVYW